MSQLKELAGNKLKLKYCSKKIHFTKDIEDFLLNSNTKGAVKIKDQRDLSEEREFLKKFYKKGIFVKIRHPEGKACKNNQLFQILFGKAQVFYN